MKTGKKVFVSLLSLLTLAGCGGKTSASDSSDGEITWTDEKPAYAGETYTGTQNLTGLEADEKTELLGQMEAYANKYHLTGIPLYGDGGYTLISERISLPTDGYVTNYGFGTLREGKITKNMDASQESVEAWQGYYHTATASVTSSLSSIDASDTSTSALVGYITSSLFNTRLVKNKDANKTYQSTYEWYGSLANQDEPTPMDEDYETTGSSKKWQIKVKTGKNSNLKFKTLSTKSVDGKSLASFNDKEVTVEDYLFALKVLLTYSYGNYYYYQYASDTTEIAGAADYVAATYEEGMTSDAAKEAWENVGYKKIDDETIEVEFAYSTDTFGAMYRLSDMLLCPINEEFYTLVTTLDADGAIDGETFDNDRYAKTVAANQVNNNAALTPADTVLSLGAYTVSQYEAGTGTDNQIVYVKNDEWVDTVTEKAETGYDIYQIPGIVVNINSAMLQDSAANYNNFKAGKTDTSSIPASASEEEAGDKPYKYWEDGTSVWKLQCNTLNQAEWNNIFGADGEVYSEYQTTNPDDYYHCKPIMANDNFINGVYVSIDREELADYNNADIGYTFFADSYEIDPINHVSYNSTDAHKKAIKNYYPDTYGYNLEAAKQLFSKAIDEEVEAKHYKAGTADNPTIITLDLAYQSESQVTTEGVLTAKYIEDAFNAVGLEKGFKLELNVFAPAEWSDVYYTMTLVGQFDFAFASISGSTLDPLNFMNTLCSNSRSSFTLSWGAHTNWVTGDITYDGKAYSYDAMYEALVLGDAVIENGELVY